MNRALRDVLHADSVGFLLPGTGGPPMYSEEQDHEALARFPEVLPPALSDGTPLWRRCLEKRVCTIATVYGAEVDRYLASAYYCDYARPGGAGDTLALGIPLGGQHPGAAASLHFWRERRGGRHAFGDRALAILELLLPAFRAGVEARRRFGAARSNVLAMLDALGQAVLVFDDVGRVLHQTPAVRALLAVDHDHRMLQQAARQAAMETQQGDIVASSSTAPTVRTRSDVYRLSASRYTEPSSGARLILVALERRAVRPSTEDDLRRRFGLTPAESRVALLLGQGRSNAAIAAALSISPFTARRHTERVLAKLSVRSRAEVPARIAP